MEFFLFFDLKINIITWRLEKPCLTGNGLKMISDGALSPSVATIDSITLDGNKI